VAADAQNGWLLDGRQNDAFAAVNRLLRRGVEVRRLQKPVDIGGRVYCAGSFHVPAADARGELKKLSKRYHLEFAAAPTEGLASAPVKTLNVGVYQRLYGGNVDEGWTRWLLEQYGFRYRTVTDKEVKKGKLAGRYDAIILPADPKCVILGEGIEEYYEKRFQGTQTLPRWPPEYRSGIGKEGMEKLKEFVEQGGSLLCLGEATELALDELKLLVKNVLADVKQTEFVCPGSTLHVNVDPEHPLAWGVQGDLLIIFRNHPAFEVKPHARNDEYAVVLSYPDSRIMESGWLVGEERLARKAALVEARLGKGRAVLYGFPPQYRAQSDAAFKLLFNALLG